MPVTREQLRDGLVNGLGNILASRIAARFMTPEAHRALTCLQQFFAIHGSTTDPALDTLVTLYNALPQRMLTGAAASSKDERPKTWWWEFWGLDIGDEPPVILLAAVPEVVCTQEQAEANLKIWESNGYRQMELRRTLR